MAEAVRFSGARSMTDIQRKPALVAIDDDPEFLEFLAGTFEGQGFEFVTSTDPTQASQLVRQYAPEVVLLDMVMPLRSGMTVLEELTALHPSLNVVLLTGQYTPEAAVEAIEKGAADFLPKPISVSVLRQRVQRLFQEASNERIASNIEEQLLKSRTFHGIVGRSPAIQELFQRISRIAPHYQNALITGPTGSGKELVARALRDLSPVADGPLVIVNCAAIVESLFESELFGHVKGAFTGAATDRAGMFEAADEGTLFLDEIEELSPAGQAKLLRVLQEREVQRVGSAKTKQVNVRVIAASNRDLRKLVQEKQFREDLFYRLAMIEVRVPSLAERLEDLELLLTHFLHQYSQRFGKQIPKISRSARAALFRYDWPGNVRELENVVGNAVMTAEGPLVDVEHLGTEIVDFQPSPQSGTTSVFTADNTLKLEDVENRYIEYVLELESGNVSRAALRLGVPRSTLYTRVRLMKTSKSSP